MRYAYAKIGRPTIMGRVLTVLIVILLAILVFRLGNTWIHNRSLARDFVENASMSEYIEKVPIQQMNFSTYINALLDANTAYAHNYTKTVVAPISLQYYAIPDSKSGVVFEIPRGTLLIAIPTEEIYEFLPSGYGFIGFPTYENGWRYAKPFLKSGDAGDFSELPSYYIRTTDLEAVARKVIDENQTLQADARMQRQSKYGYAQRLVRSIDDIFYKKGIYNAPDLQIRVMDVWNYLLLGISIVLATIFLQLRRVNRTGRKITKDD